MYQALYRKWRPAAFDDVVSQSHITVTLKNQILNGKTAHAYLFTGSRGTGKTTCARIFAKAVNCPNAKDGNPCLECDICKDAESGALADIIEIDAASNNGVDDIRDLREGAVFTPERCAYKVYIIDEVHMLSQSAFNALLKIMEEPPPYVKFILATTEVHKVPATVLSRCQRFDFRRILPEDISARLLYIAGEEGIELDEQAAALIARIADGGMRDALSLLDQCVAFSEHVSLDTVSAAAGIAGRDEVFDLLEAILRCDGAKAIILIDSLYSRSKDMQRLCEEMIAQFRNLMLVKTVPANKSLLACMPEECDRLLMMAETTGLDTILSCLDILQSCNERLSRSLTKRTELEMCLIRLTQPMPQNNANLPKGVDNSEIYAKIEQLEERLEALSAGGFRERKQVFNKPVVKEEAPKPQEPPIRAEDFTILTQWADVLEELSKRYPGICGALNNSKAFSHENILLIVPDNSLFGRLFKNPENAKALSDTVRDVLGKTYMIRAKSVAEPKQAVESPAESLVKKAIGSQIPVELQ